MRRKCRVRCSPSHRILRRAVQRSVKNEKLPYPSLVDIFLVEDEEIRVVNQERRGTDEVTDVLSFPMWSPGETPLFEGDTKRIFLGDILIAKERAASQAKELGHSLKRELGYLATHGLLHLLGYEHEREEDKSVMRQKEEAVMERMRLMR